jgi:uncharacterized protein (DUF2252 family)
MRDPVAATRDYNAAFPPDRLQSKATRLAESPFTFYRGSFFLFCSDLHSDWGRLFPLDPAQGPIVGDLHAENFGSFRAVNKEVVYDINDFDEATDGPYDLDLRRLATSLILAGKKLSDSVAAVEEMTEAYVKFIRGHADIHSRDGFRTLQENDQIQRLLVQASERDRVEFLKDLAHQTNTGFCLNRNAKYFDLSAAEMEAVRQEVPQFLRQVLAPSDAEPTRFRVQDIAGRVAGVGSLGRARFALLFDKGKNEAEWKTLRLIEWKQSLNSAWHSPTAIVDAGRSKEVFDRTIRHQLAPKRYIGWLRFAEMEMQTREIGANDRRFQPTEWSEASSQKKAAAAVGIVTARSHLLAAGDSRTLLGFAERLKSRQLSAFSVAYAEQTRSDWEKWTRRGF